MTVRWRINTIDEWANSDNNGAREVVFTPVDSRHPDSTTELALQPSAGHLTSAQYHADDRAQPRSFSTYLDNDQRR